MVDYTQEALPVANGLVAGYHAVSVEIIHLNNDSQTTHGSLADVDYPCT